jgi:hypothetical protein
MVGLYFGTDSIVGARRHVGGGKKLAKQLAAQDLLKQIIPQFFIDR